MKMTNNFYTTLQNIISEIDKQACLLVKTSSMNKRVKLYKQTKTLLEKTSSIIKDEFSFELDKDLK